MTCCRWHYESDGDRWVKTHYLVYSDNERRVMINFPNKRRAMKFLREIYSNNFIVDSVIHIAVTSMLQVEQVQNE